MATQCSGHILTGLVELYRLASPWRVVEEPDEQTPPLEFYFPSLTRSFSSSVVLCVICACRFNPTPSIPKQQSRTYTQPAAITIQPHKRNAFPPSKQFISCHTTNLPPPPCRRAALSIASAGWLVLSNWIHPLQHGGQSGSVCLWVDCNVRFLVIIIIITDIRSIQHPASSCRKALNCKFIRATSCCVFAIPEVIYLGGRTCSSC